MKNIKEQLEEVINKKHNELFKIDYNMDYNTKLNLQRKILEDLADEVLKVVVENYREAINFAIDEINQDATYLIRDGAREGILKLVDYKLHLSPNKENKNNE